MSAGIPGADVTSSRDPSQASLIGATGNSSDPARHGWIEPKDVWVAAASFVSSGFFFMIVGAIFLFIAYRTMGSTHAAMSFVLVVVGVAILFYGTGTQSMGEFHSDQEKSAKYKVVLAGGAGALAFCVAAGIITYSERMKLAFQIEQKYLRLHIKGKGYQRDDIGLYLPDIRINGNPVPAVRRGDYIEVYVPYLLNAERRTFEMRVKLHLVEKAGSLQERPDHVYNLVLLPDGGIEEQTMTGTTSRGRSSTDAGYDFPRYALVEVMNLLDQGQIPGTGIVPQ